MADAFLGYIFLQTRLLFSITNKEVIILFSLEIIMLEFDHISVEWIIVNYISEAS